MGSGRSSFRNNLPPTRRTGNEATFKIQLYFYQRVTEDLRALETRPVCGLLYSLP